MKALAQDIRKLLADRIQSASAADLFAIATSICANDESPPAVAVVASSGRYTKLDLHGRVTLGVDWVAVHDAETNLIWTRGPLECGELNWKDAMAAAGNYRLFGKEDWRAPTVKEYVSIFDYSKFGPVVDKEYFTSTGAWEWTSQVDAESPSDCAWSVYLRNGLVSRDGQTAHIRVRAVRAGQSLHLGL